MRAALLIAATAVNLSAASALASQQLSGEITNPGRSCGITLDSGPLSEAQRECAGEFLSSIEAIRAGDADRDGRDAMASGDPRLVHYSESWGPSGTPGVTCRIPPSDQMIRVSRTHIDVVFGAADLDLRAMELDYAAEFNRAVVGHPDYPFRDICRTSEAEFGYEGPENYELARTPWLNHRSEGRVTDLNSAVRTGSYARMSAELEAGADPNSADIWGFTPLMWAAFADDTAAIELLLRYGADAEHIAPGMPTPLMLATRNNSLPAVRILVGAGADPDATPFQGVWNTFGSERFISGRSARNIALRYAYADIAEYFAQSVHLFDGAAFANALRSENSVLVRLFIERHEADIRASDGLLNFVALAAASGHAEALRELLRWGGTEAAHSDFEQQIWSLAADRAPDDVLLTLVIRGEPLNFATRNERMVFRAAIANGVSQGVPEFLGLLSERRETVRREMIAGNLRPLRELLADGATLDERMSRTLLMMATERRHLDTVRWLLANGASPVAIADFDLNSARTSGLVDARENTRFRGRMTPLELAIFAQDAELLSALGDGQPEGVLSEFDPYWSDGPINEVIRGYRNHRDLDLIMRAIDLAGWPEARSTDADRLLSTVCAQIPYEEQGLVVRLLLDRGVRPPTSEDSPYPNGPTPNVSLAADGCIGSSSEAAILLLEAGVDPNQTTWGLNSYLVEALTAFREGYDRYSVIASLLRHGADPNNADYDRLPLDIAISRSERDEGFLPIVALLRSYGARTEEELIEAGELEAIVPPPYPFPIRTEQ